jgi:antitoxin component of RelBE/YafQ-DinJ toxin-antitoxin module
MNQTRHPMTSNTHLQTWVSREFKERFAKLAQAQGLSESALLRRLLENLVPADRLPDDVLVTPVEKVSSAPRVSVRLRADDLLLLQARQYRLS